ncbi:MAG: Holliday junction branch migration DNA helicase RuvB [Patescibacteria group bacterium]
MSEEALSVPKLKTDDEVGFDLSLRPQTLVDYIGQEKIRDILSIAMEAAKGRGDTLEHVLLSGPPGLGKTTLAHIIAREMGVGIRVTSGPALERAGDLAAILTNLSPGDILFIDEIHRISKTITESLYPAMEDFCLDIILGKGPGARTIRLDVPRFTLIGATTKTSMLTAPLRDRFGNLFHLEFYDHSDMLKIVNRSARIMSVPADEDAADLMAARSRSTPRIANRILKRIRDYAQVRSDGSITRELAEQALSRLGIDEKGLDHMDRKILSAIIEKFSGGPVGLNTLAASLGEEMETIEDVYEPYLMQQGLLNRTPRGRVTTDAAWAHLGIDLPKSRQGTIL